MGAEAIAALLKWPALVAGVLALLFGIYKLIQRNAAKGAVAKDDLRESEAAATIQSRVAKVKRESPKTPVALSRHLKRKLRDAAARKPRT